MPRENSGEIVSTIGPYANGDEFASDVINQAKRIKSPDFELIVTPEEAMNYLPKQTPVELQESGKTDHEMWSEVLMRRGWSHESRAHIIIAKSETPLYYWEVRKALEQIERKGELEGWLPYA